MKSGLFYFWAQMLAQTLMLGRLWEKKEKEWLIGENQDFMKNNQIEIWV